MKTHSRCCHCGKRRKLPKHPDEYRLQPKCIFCGARSWRMDAYRHRVELAQIRAKTGRYRVCHSDCMHHPHRLGSIDCKLRLDADGQLEWKPDYDPRYIRQRYL